MGDRDGKGIPSHRQAKGCPSLTRRRAPPGVTGEALDRHTTNWVERVNRSGAAYLTPAVVDGRWLVRVSVGALATQAEDVAQLWETMRRAAEADTP